MSQTTPKVITNPRKSKAKAAEKVEVVPIPAPEVKPEPKVEVKPEVKVDVKTEVKPEVKVEVKPDVKPEVESEVKEEVPLECETPSETIKMVFARLEEISKDLRAISQVMKKIVKVGEKSLKDIPSGKGRKKAVVDPNKPPRAPSGFAKPGPISTELAEFLSVPPTTEMARTEVTKRITQYVREKNLQDPNNRRVIKLDPALQELLKPNAGEEVTYFNLQRYMKIHFPKKPTA